MPDFDNAPNCRSELKKDDDETHTSALLHRTTTQYKSAKQRRIIEAQEHNCRANNEDRDTKTNDKSQIRSHNNE